ncbi:hypothetical protein [Ferdinandcohnia sp. Marseille-Q9671]
MKKLRKILVLTGLALCILSVLLLLATLLFPSTYFSIALANSFTLPFVAGVFLMILSFFLAKSEKNKSTVIKKAIYVILLFALLNFFIQNPIVASVRDIQAVVANNLYVTEGEVIETYIERKSRTSQNARGFSDKYYQYIKLNNNHQDEFIIQVASQEDYIFQQGQTYQITALPYSRIVLEWE